MTAIPSHPVLSAAQTSELEGRLFGDDERGQWRAMTRAGVAVATAALLDLQEAGGMPAAGRILVLAGKGNNAGDALIAAREVLGRFPGAACDVLFVFGPRALRAPAARAWRGLCESARGRVRTVSSKTLCADYDVCLDGIFGFQYRPPLPPEAEEAIAAAARRRVRLNAAVDLPSGLDGKGAFRADFTYATGVAKTPLLGCVNAGRPRYLDLGFFSGKNAGGEAASDRVLLRSILAPLAGLRPAGSDKRSQGHVALVGGSEGTPGAILMAVLAALRSGAGLVSAFVPEPLAAAFAARAPGAMWVGLPTTKLGGLSPRGLDALLARSAKATAFVVGPGIGTDPKTVSLVGDMLSHIKAPVVIDAEALQPGLVRCGRVKRILTPHAGEFERISAKKDLRLLSRAIPGAIVAKGAVTRICAGGPVYHSFCGGPVLSRGGSGDLLSGLAGGLLAQTPADPLLAACRAAVWHGSAADLLARARGQTAVDVTELLDFLAEALREASSWLPS